jgi:hypothetical protein
MSAAFLTAGRLSRIRIQCSRRGRYAEAFGAFGYDTIGDGAHVGLRDGSEGSGAVGDALAWGTVELDESLLAASCTVGTACFSIVVRGYGVCHAWG